MLSAGTSAVYCVAPRFSVYFLSASLAAAIPLIIGGYWIVFSFAPASVGPLLRVPVLFCCFALAVLWSRAPLTHAEISLFRVLSTSAALWLIPSLMATSRGNALSGWVKLLVLFAVCWLTARGLRHPSTAKAMGMGLLACAAVVACFLLFKYLDSEGFKMPTYKAAREFKGVAEAAGLPLNSIAFTAVFSYLTALCLVPVNWALIAGGVPLFLVCSFFTGSRAPLAVLLVSVGILLCICFVRSGSPSSRLAAALVSVCLLAGVISEAVFASRADLTRITEGRSRLWVAALEKFMERPLFGFGYESWSDDLVSRLPGEEQLTLALAKKQGGSYHNQYVLILAEEGLIGLSAAALVIWLLLRSSWLLAFRAWYTVHRGLWPLFTCIFLLLRANVEVTGLFGYGQDPADYLAYVFASVLVSRFSTEEDAARALAQREAWSV